MPFVDDLIGEVRPHSDLAEDLDTSVLGADHVTRPQVRHGAAHPIRMGVDRAGASPYARQRLWPAVHEGPPRAEDVVDERHGGSGLPVSRVGPFPGLPVGV
ncbi:MULTISPECIES: hypothetical protein, partial [unclassified Mycobacterium]|uniref:hypothetical protein n=1 Tax=unclassified Mycobacterium TaxID=2642494 RepID=UPI001E5B1ED7